MQLRATALVARTAKTLVIMQIFMLKGAVKSRVSGNEVVRSLDAGELRLSQYVEDVLNRLE